jgi:hypothetical protein
VLWPAREISSSEAVEDVFSFKGLELVPFGNVVSEALDFDFDQGKRSFEGKWASCKRV